ncbi:MAG TPA: HIT family protein [Rhodocyclaceae bacterium]|nr:HIT family protein [Rhodocyclaceae bacterium]
MTCPLCEPTSETVLWRDARCRVILVDDADYPGFCRVIWTAHVAEMTALDADERAHLLAVVFATEQALRELLRPDKINLASLGNVVPHLHWHVIPRFVDDRHFPEPIWGRVQRAAVARDAPAAAELARAIGAALAAPPADRGRPHD